MDLSSVSSKILYSTLTSRTHGPTLSCEAVQPPIPQICAEPRWHARTEHVQCRPSHIIDRLLERALSRHGEGTTDPAARPKGPAAGSKDRASNPTRRRIEVQSHVRGLFPPRRQELRPESAPPVRACRR